MKQDKRDGYNLTASIHTLEIEALYEEQTVTNDMKSYVTKSNVNEKGIFKAIINPNKFQGDLFSYKEFQAIFRKILESMRVDGYNIRRTDLRFDSYDPKHYQEYKKLNRYLICMLACAYKVKNCYKTDDLFSFEQLSVAIKNSDFEIENYRRDKKSEITKNTTEPAKSRLEERSKHHNAPEIWTDETLKQIFVDDWFRRWDKALEFRKTVEQRYNDNLAAIYFRDKNATPVQFKSLQEFLRKYQECIFTRAQLIDLLKRIGVENPESKANNFKRDSKIEYFSKTDVQFAINQIKTSTLKFFEPITE